MYRADKTSCLNGLSKTDSLKETNNQTQANEHISTQHRDATRQPHRTRSYTRRYNQKENMKKDFAASESSHHSVFAKEMFASSNHFLVSDFRVQTRDMHASSVQFSSDTVRKEPTPAPNEETTRTCQCTHTQRENNKRTTNVPTLTTPQRSKTGHPGNGDRSQAAVQYSVRWRPNSNQPW